MVVRPSAGRDDPRLARLARLVEPDVQGRTVDGLARAARCALWDSRPRSNGDVLLRADLVLRRNRVISPIRQIATSRSPAVQMLLVAIFAAQCGQPRYAGSPTALKLRDPAEVGRTCWRELVALPAQPRGGVSRGLKDKQLDQIRSALTCLEKFGRVELARPSGRNRFEGFRLLNETVLRGQSSVPYTVPGSREPIIRVPVSFFTNGWVHTLYEDEIIVYLFLLWCTQQQPLTPFLLEHGLHMPNERWQEAFERSRAHLTAYRTLYRIGLIRALRSESRREDGTVDKDEVRPYDEMHFFVDLDQLDDDAAPRVTQALRLRRADVPLDQAYALGQGARPPRGPGRTAG
jgi:hypothetical protein